MPDPIAAGCGVDMDWRDPTITGRDPSFDPNSQTFDADDPSGAPFFRLAGGVLSTGTRLARPSELEQINTQTGRRLRDSFMPGSGTISNPVMRRMYDVLLCEAAGTADVSGNGLAELGIANEAFFASGNCRTNEEVGQDGTVAELRAGAQDPSAQTGADRAQTGADRAQTGADPAPATPGAGAVRSLRKTARLLFRL